MEQAAIIPVMGNDVPFCKTLTIADITAPILIWIKPISADALPALWLNGAIESADALGNINPWQHKNINIKITVTYKLFNPNMDVTANIIPTPF